MPSSKTYVLIHGAWHGSWCWNDVKYRLEAKGHKVFTPVLTGVGERAVELDASVGLDTHIQDVISMIDDNSLSDIILVGHSYSGMVITGVADQRSQQISHIVYLDAVVPVNGRSMINAHLSITDDETSALTQELSQMAPDGIGIAAFPPEVFSVPQEHPKYAWVKDNLTPHPLKSWIDKITLTKPPFEHRTFIHAVNPVIERSTIPIFAAEAENSKAWQYYEVDTGHDVMITAPEALAVILLGIGA